MKSIASPTLRPLAAALSLLALFLWACHLKEPKRETVLSLGIFADTLKAFDEVRIHLKDAESGDSLETLFSGKVGKPSDLTDLPARHYEGGPVLVVISAWKDGNLAYRVERAYDGSKVTDIRPLVLPGAAVTLRMVEIELAVGEESGLPDAVVRPDELADKRVEWTSSRPEVVSLVGGRYKGEKPGTARLTASLRADPARQASFEVRVVTRRSDAPDSLRIDPDTLEAALRGRIRQFGLKVYPASAEAGALWQVEQVGTAAIARVDSTGRVEALSKGLVKVWAVSQADRGVTDTAWVKIVDEVKVEKVEIAQDRVDLALNGAPESLTVEVLPLLADPAIEFRSKDSSIAYMSEGRVHAKMEGETWVYAASARDVSRKDSVKVVVGEPHRIDAVILDRDTILLWVGGPGRTLKAEVRPATAPQNVVWSTSDAGKAGVDAAGVVSPGKEPGTATLRARSKQDTTAMDEVRVTVRRDPPRLDVGSADTTVAVKTLVTFRPVVTQDFGTVVRFEWDLDGDGTPEGVSTSEKEVAFAYPEEKEYPARFLVRDSEGNDTLVIKRVKAVSGLVINIVSPTNRSSTNQREIDVVWKIGEQVQSTGQKETLLLRGANSILRSAKDEAGRLWADSITVFYDPDPPAKPDVSGPALTRSRTPRWTWKSGGNGGNGRYRASLDSATLATAPEIRDSIHQPESPLGEGPHTLYVQEQDDAGNWSDPASFRIVVDFTSPEPPKVASARRWTNAPGGEWSWKTGGNGGNGNFFVNLGSEKSPDSNAVTTDTAYSAPNLAEGSHTLFVYERDAAGNWSKPGSLAVQVDRTTPPAPVFTSVFPSLLSNPRPTWTWKSGGPGGHGLYRIRLDNPLLEPMPPVITVTHTPPTRLGDGKHRLYIQEGDSAGNWSPPVSQELTLAVEDTLGVRGFAAAGTAGFDFAICPDGTPHIAFADAANGNRLSVMRFQGGTWSTVGGPGFSAFAVTGHVTADCSPANKVYASASGAASMGELYAFGGSSWSKVGAAGFGEVAELTFDLSPNGVPWVAYADGAGNVKVDSLASNNAWVSSGSLAAFGTTAVTSFTAPLQLFCGVPKAVYLQFSGKADNSRPHGWWIDYFDKGVWKGGTNSFLSNDPTASYYSAQVLAPGSTPSVRTVLTAAQKGVITHYLFNETTFTYDPVGGAVGTSERASTNHSQAITAIAFADKDNGDKASIRMLEHKGPATWKTLNGIGFSKGAAEFVRVGIHPLTDIPYVAFLEPGNGRKITVMKAGMDRP